MEYGKGGGPTSGVLEDDIEDSDRMVGVGSLGEINRGSAGPDSGHGGINGGCAG